MSKTSCCWNQLIEDMAAEASRSESMSRLITEEDLIDSLFFTCDVGQTGKVPVSRIIEYLQFTTGNDTEGHKESLDRLWLLLDPQRKDILLDLPTYRKAITNWIEDLRVSADNTTSSDNHVPSSAHEAQIPDVFYSPCRRVSGRSVPVPNQCLGRSPVSSFFHLSFRSDKRSSTVSTGSSLGKGSIDGLASSAREEEMTEVMNKLADVQLHNRRLTEENGQLQGQLDSAEETVATLTTQMEQLQKTFKGHQSTADRLQELRTENEELKRTLVSTEDAKKELQNQLNNTQRENTTLEYRLSQLQDQLLLTTTDLDCAQKEQQSLQGTLNEEREIKQQVEKMCEIQEEQLNERATLVERLKKLLSEANYENQCIARERTELEVQLTQAQQELALVNDEAAKLKSTCRQLRGSLERDINDSEEDLIGVKLTPSASSTPYRTLSICSEIHNSLLNNNDPSLPSPLCEKERFELFTPERSRYSGYGCPLPFDDLDREVEDMMRAAQPVSSATDKTVKITSQIKEKKEQVLKQLDQLTNVLTNAAKNSYGTVNKMPRPGLSSHSTHCDASRPAPPVRSLTPTRLPRGARSPTRPSTPKRSSSPSSRPSTPKRSSCPNSRPSTPKRSQRSTSPTSGPCTPKRSSCSSSTPTTPRRSSSPTSGSVTPKRSSSPSWRLSTPKRAVTPATRSFTPPQPDPERLRAKLHSEVASLADKLASMAAAKHHAEQRASKLAEALHRFKELKVELEEKYVQSVNKLEQESQQYSSSLQQKLTELEGQLQRETAHKQDLQQQMTIRDKAISSLTDQCSCLQKALLSAQEVKESLDKEVKSLQRANVDLADRYKKAEGVMGEMKSEMEQASEGLLQQQETNANLEESLMAQQLERQLDMKELWRLVQKDVETECLSDSQDTLSVSADSLRDQVAREIHSLRSQLARSQATLAALQSRTLPLPLGHGASRRSKSSDSKNNNNRRSPSSPLVEALTLDVYEYECNQKAGAWQQPASGTQSAEDILESHDPTFVDQRRELVTNAVDFSSCPLLGDHFITSGTQTDQHRSKKRAPQIAVSKYGVLNTSSGSSTSGVEVGSGKSEPHLLGPHRVAEGASSPEDPDSPLCRYRTSSFKKAIERGQSADSSFDTCEPNSTTSPDITPDRPGLPPYPNSRSYSSCQKEHLQSNPPVLPPPEYIVNFALSTQSGPGTVFRTAPGLAVQDKCLSASVDSGLAKGDSFDDDIFLPQEPVSGHDGSRPDSRMDSLASTGALDASAIDERQSPLVNRRLSTLVEEASDAEADESITHGHSSSSSCKPQSRGLLTKTPLVAAALPRSAPSFTGSEDFTTTDPRLLEVAMRRAATEAAKIPPQYKAPPAYREAVHSKSRDSSPQPGQRLGDCDQRRSRSQSPGAALQIDQPSHHYHSSKQSQSQSQQVVSSQSASRSREDHAELLQTQGQHRKSRTPERRHPEHSPGGATCLSELPRGQRRSLEERKKQSVGDGQLIELVNGDLEEVELSEADKLLNQQLLEEAKKATAASKHRGRRSLKSASDLTRSESFDQGGEAEDVLSPVDPRSPPLDSPPAALTPTTPDTVKSVTHEASEVDAEQKRDGPGPGSSSCLSPQQQHRTPESRTVTAPESPKPFRITTSLQKIKEENLAKKKSLTKQMRMPELAENSETESAKGNGGSSSFDSESTGESSGNAQQEKGQREAGLTSKSLESAACPSLPDRVLSRMGLQRKAGQPMNSDQFSDQEVEEKFASLSLAFKTDGLTLDKRIELHHRARDIAEQNIERELDGLKEAMKVAMSHFCTDSQSRDIYTKIRHHVEVLEQSTARMSSRAEIHGAVQQEVRMSKSIDIMVQHVENLKRLYEKEHSELEDTKKLLQENKLADGEALFNKRLGSFVGGGPGPKGGRRRASVAAFSRGPGALGSFSGQTPTKDMDPKARFQSLFSDPSSSSSSNLSSALRRASFASPPSNPLHRRASLAVSTVDRSSALSLFTSDKPRISRRHSGSEDKKPALIEEEPGTEVTDNNNKPKTDSKDKELSEQELADKQQKEEEQAFQKGFEEGVKAQVNEELADLRDQQRAFSDHLEKLMEESQALDEQMEYETLLEKVWQLWPKWRHCGPSLRLTVAGLVFSMALLSIVFTLFPFGTASRRDFYSSVSSVEELLRPFESLRHHRPPPT